MKKYVIARKNKLQILKISVIFVEIGEKERYFQKHPVKNDDTHMN